MSKMTDKISLRLYVLRMLVVAIPRRYTYCNNQPRGYGTCRNRSGHWNKPQVVCKTNIIVNVSIIGTVGFLSFLKFGSQSTRHLVVWIGICYMPNDFKQTQYILEILTIKKSHIRWTSEQEFLVIIYDTYTEILSVIICKTKCHSNSHGLYYTICICFPFNSSINIMVRLVILAMPCVISCHVLPLKYDINGYLTTSQGVASFMIWDLYIYPCPSGLLCRFDGGQSLDSLVKLVKQPWRKTLIASHESTENYDITKPKQGKTHSCSYVLGPFY